MHDLISRPTRRFVYRLLLACAALLAAIPAESHALGLPRIFNHHMLLQRGTNTSVWGWGTIGEEVTVQLQGEQAQTVTTTVDANGRWIARFGEITATTNAHQLSVSALSGSATYTNVIIGDVWFCAGQSNMDMAMFAVSNATAELADAAYPFIRLFQVRPVATGMNMAVDIQFKPLNSSATNEGWSASRENTARLYSAIGFSFARALHKTNGIPIGLIQVSVGATGCDQYVDPQAFMDDPRFGPTNNFTRTNYFNGSIAPITNFAIRGALWYQGEQEGSSATGAWRYRDQIDVLIKSWRATFPAGDFPFIAVQIHNWGAIDSTRHWDELRESQSTILLTNNTALVVGVDVGDPLDLHPANKIPLGQRAALAARALSYGETSLIYQGPVLASNQVSGTNVTLTFTSVGTGLVVRGAGGALKGFQIAGANSNFVHAIATIVSSNQVVVNSPRVAVPVAVRYSWYFNPQEANLGNSVDLPANVFRTDSFGLFSGGPNRLGDLTFRGNVALVSNEASSVYRADLRRTGVYPESGPTLLTNLVWSFDTGAKVRSTVAVKDGTVVFTSQNTNIYAVALADGSPLWQFNAGKSSHSLDLDHTYDFAGAPVFADGVVMVPMKDKLIVLDPSNGTYRYSFEAQPGYLNGDDRVASPTLVDDTVLFGGVARMFGLDPRTGNVKTHRTLHWNGASPAFTRCAAAVENGFAYFTEPTFFSINLTNLAVAGLTINDNTMNTKPAPSAVAPCAAISGGSAVFTRSNEVLSVNLATRATNWIFTGADHFDSSPAVFNGKVYIGGNDGNLYALDLATGASNWTFATAGAVKSSPAIASDQIYFGSADGKVYIVNTNGALVSSYQTGGPIYTSPVLKDGLVLIGSDDGRIYALNGTAPTFLTVSYNGNGNTSGTPPHDGTEYQPDDSATVLGNTNGLVRNGFLFNGWNTAANGLGASYAPGGNLVLGPSSVTLYAQWVDDPNTFSVTYSGNGNTGGLPPSDINVYAEADTVTVLGNTNSLVKTAFLFNGWNTEANGSGTSYVAGSTFAMDTADITLFAQWTAAPTYTVTYNGNGNTGGAVPVDTQAYTEGVSVTVRGNTNNLTRGGHLFNGWNTAANGLGASYSAGANFMMGTAPVTLYAQWIPAAAGTLSAYEGFDITPGNGALAGASGATSSGWTNTWTVGVTNHVIAVGLGYTNSGVLVTAGGAAQLATSSGSNRQFTPAYTTSTGTIWVSFIGRVASNSSWSALSLFNVFGNEFLTLGKQSDGTNWGVRAWGTGGSTQYSTLPVVSQAFVVARIDFNSSTGLDDVRVWINPELAEVPPSDAGATLTFLGVDLQGSTTATRFNRVRLQQGTAGNNGVFDEIRIGTTWGVVAPFSGGDGGGDDADGDGMPDAWEMDQFNTITNTPSADNDGDGVTNSDEYVADTEPLNPTSYFEVTGAWQVGSTNIAVLADGRSNRHYHLWRSTNDLVSSPQWELIHSTPLLAFHTNVVLVDSNHNNLGAAWYKLQVELP